MMGKIIEHNFKRKAGRAGRDLLAGSFGCYMQDLEERKALLGEMVMQARLFLEQQEMDPREFILSEPYLREFLFPSVSPDEEDYVEIVYLNCCGGRAIALCQFASWEEEEGTVTYQFYSRELSSDRRTLWKVYDFRTKEWVNDAADCFDIGQVMNEYERFFPLAKNKD